ncbi:hypothetical protein PV963_06235 [Streptomyces coeruleorubidus]|uniref:hypothetical protein n=1 Tax=Streptomyces coeruleorubidus TaxID=116188 RepID=UPI00237F984D|nr:hypothetical protein [Streptomyces coeruleorubidus]WDV49989.1 hypothetical protein PV963_06235 [Streptomyces coeruleorubidus]
MRSRVIRCDGVRQGDGSPKASRVLLPREAPRLLGRTLRDGLGVRRALHRRRLMRQGYDRTRTWRVRKSAGYVTLLMLTFLGALLGPWAASSAGSWVATSSAPCSWRTCGTAASAVRTSSSAASVDVRVGGAQPQGHGNRPALREPLWARTCVLLLLNLARPQRRTNLTEPRRFWESMGHRARHNSRQR